MKNNVVLIAGSILVILFLFWIIRSSSGGSGPAPLDTFATCLGTQGATFYGAFWCSHCANQKAQFGKSAKLLPYVECSTADGQSQLPACKSKGITSYPTWEFVTTADNGSATTTRLTGEIALTKLAEITSCPLPAGTPQ
ncbi:MAG TPA: hypothetical protein VJJ22_01960 [Candidatus Paceibacterota bacterium]